jgi:Type I restriction modification DNA specificity domain.
VIAVGKIDTSKWEAFPISMLFSVVKGTRLTKANMRDGNINFIGASAINNGITAHIANDEHIHPENTITITYNGSVGEAFYQDKIFWASDDVNVLYPKFALNKYIALFIIPVLKQAGEKYAFIDKWKKEDMEKDCILLPVDDNHQPDFSYMESYMKNREITISEALTKLQSAKRFLKSRNAEFESWKTYRIKDIFPNIVKPVVYHTREVKENPAGIPYVVRSKFNNGVKYYVERPNSNVNPAKVISFGAENATFFYQQSEWISGRDMYYIDTRGIDEYACLFITSCLQPIAEKYSYNYGMFPDLLKEDRITLPANENGDPDYAFMKQYMKVVESKVNNTVKLLSIV